MDRSNYIEINGNTCLQIGIIGQGLKPDKTYGIGTVDGYNQIGKLVEIGEGGEGIGLRIVQNVNSPKDMYLIDGNDNVLMEIYDGHIKTKNFDSRTLNIQAIEDYTKQPSYPFLDLRGKTVGFLGDSITAGSGASSNAYRYSTVFCKLAGCTEVNLGVGGTCIANNTTNGLSSQRFITRVTGEGYPDIIRGLDLLFVFGGTNDFSYDSKPVGDPLIERTRTGSQYIGDKTRDTNPDTDTFSGGVGELIKAIKTVYTTLPVVFMTPLNRGEYGSPARPNSYETNVNGNYLTDFNNAIKTICYHYGIPVFDTQAHFPYSFVSSSTRFSDDHLHPNNYGHQVLAKALYRWTISNLDIAFSY